jgi:hypothetical protein
MAYMYDPDKHRPVYVCSPEKVAARLTALKKTPVPQSMFIGGSAPADHAVLFSEVIANTRNLMVDTECGVHTIRAVIMALERDGCAINEICLLQQDDPQFDEMFARAFAKNTSLQKITASGARVANCAANSTTATHLEVYRSKTPIDSSALFWGRIAAMPALCKFAAILEGTVPFELFYRAWPGRCRTMHFNNRVICERIVLPPTRPSDDQPTQAIAPEVPPRRASKRIRKQ